MGDKHHCNTFGRDDNGNATCSRCDKIQGPVSDGAQK